MYEKTFESGITTKPTSASGSWLGMVFVFPWDAFLLSGSTELAKVFRDGTKVQYAIPSGGHTLLSRVGGYAAFYVGDGKVYGAYELDQLPNPNEVLNPLWPVPYALSPNSQIGVMVDDRRGLWLRCANQNALGVYDLKNGALLKTVTHGAGEYLKTLSWAQEGQVVGVGPSGKVRVIDYLAGAVVETGRVDAHMLAAYDCAFKVTAALGQDWKMRIYCREAWPHALSNPAFEPAQVRGLQANLVRVRLTGQDGEPCPDWWVHWSLEAPGGPAPGRLDRYVSKTDKDGWASNFYFGPDDGSTGQATVKAWVAVN